MGLEGFNFKLSLQGLQKVRGLVVMPGLGLGAKAAVGWYVLALGCSQLRW